MPNRHPTPSTLLLLGLLIITNLNLTLAAPTRDTRRRSLHNLTPDLTCLTLPTIPGASTPLPSPTGLHLKHVALGVGTQNYTCATPHSTATPSSAGALAALYDIGPFLASPLGHLFEKALPPLALAMYGAQSSSSSLDRRAAADETWWPALVRQMPWAEGQQILSSAAFGLHFFASSSSASSSVDAAGVGVATTSTLTPTWDLLPDAALYPDEAASIVWQGQKVASADAPADACKGLAAEGAVPWLYLTKAGSDARDDDDDVEDGITAVYRVVTAGGMQPETCEGVGGREVEVKYAAEYWFYGP